MVADQSTTRDGLRLVQRLARVDLVIQSVLIIVSFATGVQISLSHGVRGEDYGWAQSGRFAGTLNTPSAAATMLVVCLLGALTPDSTSRIERERSDCGSTSSSASGASRFFSRRRARPGSASSSAAPAVLRAAVRRGELRAQRLLALRRRRW